MEKLIQIGDTKKFSRNENEWHLNFTKLTTNSIYIFQNINAFSFEFIGVTLQKSNLKALNTTHSCVNLTKNCLGRKADWTIHNAFSLKLESLIASNSYVLSIVC